MSFIGALPVGAFALPSQGSPRQSFLWGNSGARMTPEDIALTRRRAQQLQAAGMDFSPVGHWAQGLARLAQAWVGKDMEKQAGKASEQNRAESDAALAALLTPPGSEVPVPGGTNPSIASILTNPYVSDEVRGLASKEWERQHPKPVVNDTVNDYGFILNTLGKDAADNWLRRKGDPMIATSIPGGNFYSGFASDLPAVLGSIQGGGQPGVQPPATLPPDFDFKQGGPASKTPATFR